MFRFQSSYKRAALLVAGLLSACSIVQPVATHYNNGLELYQSDQLEPAIVEFDQALARDSELGEVYGLRGVAHFRLGHTQLAQDDLSRAVELNVRDADVFGSLGLIVAAQGEDEAALTNFNNAIELGLEDGRVFAARGLLLSAQGDAEAALEDLGRAIEMDAGSAHVFAARGLILQDMEQDDDALDDLSEAIDLETENPLVYYFRGSIHNDREDADAALDDLERAIELDGDYAAAYALRGIIQYYEGDEEEALGDLDAAIDLGYESSPLHFVRGLILEEQDGRAAALDDFTRAIELEYEQADVYTHRGQAYVENGNLQAALDDFTKAIELDPVYANAYRERALLYTAVGEEEAALDDFKRAIDLNVEDDEMFNRRGDIFYELGQYEDAVGDYIEADDIGASSTIRADDFRSSASGWAIDRTDEIARYDYVQRKYQISILKPYRLAWVTSGNLSDVVIDVDTELAADPGFEYGWGVMCRLGDDADAYRFVITSRGRYAIIRQGTFGGTIISDFFLSGWSSTNVINTEEGAVNHIRASCIGDTLTLEINGNFLAEVNDDDYDRGAFAMVAETTGSVEHRVLFDNLIVHREEPEIGALRGAIDAQPDRRVLVVCDNFLPGNERFCSASAINNALDSVGYEAITINTLEAGIPEVEFLNEFDVVFWSLGDDCCNSPHAASVDVIKQYLDEDGQLFIDGGSIATAWPNSPFLQSYLGADHAGFGELLDMVPGADEHPLLEGIEGPIELNRAPFTPDVIEEQFGVSVIFERGTKSPQQGNPAMVAYEIGERRVAFAAFPLKELPSSVLEQLLDNALRWFQVRREVTESA